MGYVVFAIIALAVLFGMTWVVASLVCGHRIAFHPSSGTDSARRRKDTHAVSGSVTAPISTVEMGSDRTTDPIREGAERVMITLATILDGNDKQAGHFEAAEEGDKLVIRLVLDEYGDRSLQSCLSPIREGIIELLQNATLWIETKDRSADLGCLIESLSAGKLHLAYDRQALEEADFIETELNLRRINDRPPVPFERLIDLAKKSVTED